MKKRSLVIALVFSLFFLPTEALAHKLNVFAYFENGAIVGEAYFNDGAPVQNSPIKVEETSTNKLLVEGETDERGQFSIPLPTGKYAEIKVSVSGGMGHMGQTTIDLTPSSSSSTSIEKAEEKNSDTKREISTFSSEISEEQFSQLVQKAVKAETAPLREELFQLRKELSKPKFTEIIGGIGYIIGLVGVLLWIGGHRRHAQ
ncbi:MULTISPECIES: hypothetical protein [Aminobacterium]|jgi:nickel transport protein|uniref:hypothetical protein n=2 Tax=Aminobacteriaceae TaxID=3029087 RepID=UPI000465C20D|nr:MULTISPECIES: hypothetical protein [Aminobacterium]